MGFTSYIHYFYPFHLICLLTHTLNDEFVELLCNLSIALRLGITARTLQSMDNWCDLLDISGLRGSGQIHSGVKVTRMLTFCHNYLDSNTALLNGLRWVTDLRCSVMTSNFCLFALFCPHHSTLKERKYLIL